MITLDQIINSNLEMLKRQEAELLKSLSFVQKARQLFESQNGSGSRISAPASTLRRRTRSRKIVAAALLKSAATQKPKAVGVKIAKVSVGKGKETRLSKIIAVMKQKNSPIASGELIQTLFKQQKEDRNFAHFRQLVYTTLTQAFKRGIVKRKGDKLLLG